MLPFWDSIHLISTTSTLFIFLSTIVYIYLKSSNQYWTRRNVNQLKPMFFFGHVFPNLLLTESLFLIITRLYRTMKLRGWKNGGIYLFNKPVYLVLNLNQIKNILTNDFKYFSDRGLYYNERDEPLSAHLFYIGGGRWHNIRTKLSPSFSRYKLKMMLPILQTFSQALEETLTITSSPVNIQDLTQTYVANVVGSCVFGLDCTTLQQNSSFHKHVNKVHEYSTRTVFLRTFANLFPNIAQVLRVINHEAEVNDFFSNLIKNMVKQRETTGNTRKDFMQSLINLKNHGTEDGQKLTIEQISAQAYGFFVAAIGTSTAALAFTMYELAKNPHIQQKLRDEINQFDELTYENIEQMEYLRQVIYESLRMHTPGNVTIRKCVKDYKVPGENVVIEKGTVVIIPLHAVHCDEEYYPNPQVFDPERFNAENRKRMDQYAFIPFGEGNRICIGKNFALLVMQVAIAAMVWKYDFRVNRKTVEPLQLKMTSVLTAPIGGIWLDVKLL